MTTTNIDHRLDEAFGLLEATHEGGVSLVLGRKLLEQAQDLAKDLMFADAQNQPEDPIAEIAQALSISDVKPDEYQRLTSAVCTVIGAYAQARMDSKVADARSSDVRDFLENTVLDRALAIQQALKPVRKTEVNFDLTTPLRGDIPAAHFAARLLTQAGLQIAMERLSPPQLRPFSRLKRPDIRPLYKGLRIFQGRVSGAGKDNDKKSLRHAVSAASKFGLDFQTASKASALAAKVESSIFNSNPVDLLVAATQRALTWLPDASDTTNFNLGPQPSYTLCWGCIEIMTAFGSAKPSGSGTGALQKIMRTIDVVVKPPTGKDLSSTKNAEIDPADELSSTIYSKLTKNLVSIWRSAGRPATLFCDDSRKKTEEARAAAARGANTARGKNEIRSQIDEIKIPDESDSSEIFGKGLIRRIKQQ